MSAIVKFKGFVREKNSKVTGLTDTKRVLEHQFLIIPDIAQIFEPTKGYENESNIQVSEQVHLSLKDKYEFNLNEYVEDSTRYFLKCFHLKVWNKNGDEIIYAVPSFKDAEKIYEKTQTEIEDFYTNYKDFVSAIMQ